MTYHGTIAGLASNDGLMMQIMEDSRRCPWLARLSQEERVILRAQKMGEIQEAHNVLAELDRLELDA